MPLEIVTVPCLSDNYAFLLHDDETGRTALVDAPEAAPIRRALDERGWTLHEIWITHHHGDHVDAVEALRGEAEVVGSEADAHRLPRLDRPVRPDGGFSFGAHEVQVMDVPGHTVGHIAFHVPDAKAAFTADSLMALGCGRLFEGTPEQMWRSLLSIRALPDDTTICSGHEYTATNARFALTVDPDNAELISRARQVEDARSAGRPTVPSTLGVEKATNPFLRADDPSLKRALGMQEATDVEVFAEVRRRKDAF